MNGLLYGEVLGKFCSHRNNNVFGTVRYDNAVIWTVARAHTLTAEFNIVTCRFTFIEHTNAANVHTHTHAHAPVGLQARIDFILKNPLMSPEKGSSMDRRSPLGILMTLLIESVSTCVDEWLQTKEHDVQPSHGSSIRTLRKPVMRVKTCVG